MNLVSKQTPPVIINLMLNTNRGNIESRTILIAVKLEPTVTDRVIITTQRLNWFINIHTLLSQNLLLPDFHMNP
jgi:hypothetical protein